MDKIRVAINGFGRIGRAAFRAALEKESLEIAAINDLGEPENLAYLLQYDSVYGRYNKKVKSDDNGINVDGQKYLCLREKDPEKLPWQKLEVDVVLECTGFFTEREGARKHLNAGAAKVIISAPTKSEDVPTYIMGVNHEKYNPEKDLVISNASCTTNALAPMAKVLNDNFGIAKSLMTTVHSYTSSQSLVDSPAAKDFRRGRAAAMNIAPSTTGAALAAAKTIPDLLGKFDGLALRVPTACVSLVDLVALLAKETTVAELNNIFVQAASGAMQGILAATDQPLVSTDFVRDPYSVTIDLGMTQIAAGNLVKILGWYDNEWGYSARLLEMAEYIGKR
ncbi:MAG: type I glyceraldehyde-3-phosphate dehydrogenase [bacterium]|nr:type I glyceraldehyde-3-phosphate dehydrogenase [bacterium]